MEPARLDVFRVFLINGVHDGFVQSQLRLFDNRTLLIDLLGKLECSVQQLFLWISPFDDTVGLAHLRRHANAGQLHLPKNDIWNGTAQNSVHAWQKRHSQIYFRQAKIATA